MKSTEFSSGFMFYPNRPDERERRSLAEIDVTNMNYLSVETTFLETFIRKMSDFQKLILMSFLAFILHIQFYVWQALIIGERSSVRYVSYQNEDDE